MITRGIDTMKNLNYQIHCFDMSDRHIKTVTMTIYPYEGRVIEIPEFARYDLFKIQIVDHTIKEAIAQRV